MTCTDAQVRLMMKERTKGRSQEQAAVKANIKSRKTVAKYEGLGQLPSELKKPRTHRTRADPFVDDWPEIEQMLSAAPELQAKSLFEWLQGKKPGKYQEGQLRTLQRRVADWRALNEAKVAVLDQEHPPGAALQTDGTWLTELEVTINGRPFNHILIHCVLPYSNWEWGAIAQSESLLAVQRALSSTLLKLGHVPEYHQTDNSSAATSQVPGGPSGERRYNDNYLALLNHFGLKPRTIARRQPEQNGDVESSHGGLKQALRQHLLLRGNRDFDSLAEYEAFVGHIMNLRNQSRRQKVVQELAVMKPLTAGPLHPYQEVRVKVNRNSLIRVQANLYSVPTHLIGQQVRVHIYEWHLDVYYRQIQVERMARIVGTNKHAIQYRHVIDSLLRKPGGFRNYRYREELFPRLVFRQSWDQLNQWYSERKADLIYLRILRVAARTLECDVADALHWLLTTATHWDETDVEQLIGAQQKVSIPQLSPLVIDLKSYDRLLPEVACDRA